MLDKPTLPFTISAPTDAQMDVMDRLVRLSIPFTAHYLPPINEGSWLLFNNGLNPHYENGRQTTRHDEVINTIISRLTFEREIDQVSDVPRGSRFGIPPHDTKEHVLPKFAKLLHIEETAVRLPTFIERTLQLRLDPETPSCRLSAPEASTYELLNFTEDEDSPKQVMIKMSDHRKLLDNNAPSIQFERLGIYEANNRVGFNFVVDLSKVE